MFICAGVVHPKAIEYLKGRNRKYLIIPIKNHFYRTGFSLCENGNSHPDDYQNSANYESQMYEHILTEAYGGKKEIKTHEFWIFFKQILEAMIIKYHITTYNKSYISNQIFLL